MPTVLTSAVPLAGLEDRQQILICVSAPKGTVSGHNRLLGGLGIEPRRIELFAPNTYPAPKPAACGGRLVGSRC